MLFIKDEQVFSVSETADLVPQNDYTALWSEFFCYLLLNGFYREGTGTEGCHPVTELISDVTFNPGEGSYNYNLGRLLSTGLRNRFLRLQRHYETTSAEQSLLSILDSLFSDFNPTFWDLSGKKILDVAKRRNFSPEMTVIAHYVAVTFGQKDFPAPTKLPRLYLSILGDIHLSRSDFYEITEPEIRYRRPVEDHDVSAVFSFLSTHINFLAADPDIPYPGKDMVQLVSGLSFMASRNNWLKSIPITRYATSCIVSSYTGIEYGRGGPLVALFYQQFLCGLTGRVKVTRQGLFKLIINVMVKKMGDTHHPPIFGDNSNYLRVVESNTIYGKEYNPPDLLAYALEALDSDLTPTDGEEAPATKVVPPPKLDEATDGDLQLPEGDLDEDPSKVAGGFDPSIPPPAVPNQSPASREDSIDLISFDKTGEGIDEDLYRSAVVALNDRLKSDDSLPVDANVKDALNHWVNGFLYRAAISATQDQIESLGLQSYLKNILKKG